MTPYKAIMLCFLFLMSRKVLVILSIRMWARIPFWTNHDTCLIWTGWLKQNPKKIIQWPRAPDHHSYFTTNRQLCWGLLVRCPRFYQAGFYGHFRGVIWSVCEGCIRVIIHIKRLENWSRNGLNLFMKAIEYNYCIPTSPTKIISNA